MSKYIRLTSQAELDIKNGQTYYSMIGYDIIPPPQLKTENRIIRHINEVIKDPRDTRVIRDRDIKDTIHMLPQEEQRTCIQWISNYIKGLDKEKLKKYILNIESEIINKRLSLEPLFLRIDNIVNIVAHIDAIKSKSKIFVINNLVSILSHRYENDEKKKVNLLLIGEYMFHHGVLNFDITNHKFDKSLLNTIFNKSNVYNYIHDKENVMYLKTIDTVILEFIALNLEHMVAIYTKNIFNAIQDTLADIKLYEQANPNDNNYITEEELTNIYKIDRHFFHRVIIL